jgi:hypothetical protein
MASHGDESPVESLRWLYEQGTKIPELAQQLLRVLIGIVPARSKEVPLPGIVWMAAATWHTVYALFRGYIPWRADQMGPEKDWMRERDSEKAAGTSTYGTHKYRTDGPTKAGQTVLFGPRDSQMTTEVGDGNGRRPSFLRVLRQGGVDQPLQWDVVPMQRGPGKHAPENLGVPFNDDDHYVDLSAFIDGSTQVVDAIGHVIAAGGPKARRIVINCQREFELFQKAVVDTQDKDSKLPVDIAMVHHFIRQLMLLRKLLLAEAPELQVVLVLPKHVGQLGTNLEDAQPWESVFKAQMEIFERMEGIKIHQPIIPEDIFVQQVQDIITVRGMQGARVYVNAEGQTNGPEKEDLCKKAFKSFESAGIFVTDDPEDATVCVMLRSNNRNIDASTRAVSERYPKIELFISPTDARCDPIDHKNPNPDQQKRVVLPFKKEVGEEILHQLGFPSAGKA